MTQVGSKGRIVKSSIAKIIGCTVRIPFLVWQIKGDLHPMPLCLKISLLWRISYTKIWMKGYGHSHKKCKHCIAQEWHYNSLMNNLLLVLHQLPPPLLLHLSYTTILVCIERSHRKDINASTGFLDIVHLFIPYMMQRWWLSIFFFSVTNEDFEDKQIWVHPIVNEIQ